MKEADILEKQKAIFREIHLLANKLKTIGGKFESLLAELFMDFSEEEIDSLYVCINKVYKGIVRMR